MTAVRSVARLIWGEEVDRALRPVIAVTLVSTAAFSAFWSYVGIWAIERLDASPSAIGVMFGINALAAAGAGYFGGRLSDRFGRRPTIVFGWTAQSLGILSLATVDDVALAIALVTVTAAVGAPGLAASNAIVADLVPPARHEAAYATTRVAYNLGFVAGPPIAAVLLAGEHWPLFFVGISFLGLLGAALARLALPGGRPPAHGEAGQASGSILSIVRDGPFALLLASTLLGFVVYVAYDAVLPIATVASWNLSPSTWGFLVIINPALVTLFQLRLTRAVERVPPAPKLALAMLLMGLPFLVFTGSHAVPVIAAVIVVFVVGEMLWTPTSTALAARMAPEHLRGAYMGAFTGTSSVAWAIAPLTALQLRAAGGDSAMWIFFAAASITGAVAGIAACRRAAIRVPDFAAPAPTAAPSGLDEAAGRPREKLAPTARS